MAEVSAGEFPVFSLMISKGILAPFIVNVNGPLRLI